MRKRKGKEEEWGGVHTTYYIYKKRGKSVTVVHPLSHSIQKRGVWTYTLAQKGRAKMWTGETISQKPIKLKCAQTIFLEGILGRAKGNTFPFVNARGR